MVDNKTIGEKSDPQKVAEFVGLLTANQNHVYSFIMSLVGNYSDAEDLLQETISVMWSKFHTYEKDSNFKNWAFTIAYNKTRDFKRKSKSHISFDEEVMQLIQKEAAKELSNVNLYLEILPGCLRELKENDHSLIKSRYFSNMSLVDISREFGYTIDMVRYRLSKVKELLRRCVLRKIVLKGT